MAGVVVPLAALAALLAVAYRHPRARTELGASLLAAAAVLATGVLDRDDLRAETDRLLPVVLFLVAILVVAECCRASGLFAAIGSRLAATSRPGLLFTATFGVAAVTTVVLSLDATVVLLTPVAIAAAAALGVPGRPYELVCVRLANVASLLLPVSNLTNLLALPDLAATDQDLSVGRFVVLMAPVWVFVLAVELAVQRWWFRTELAATPVVHRAAPLPVPVVPLVVVALMLAGFTAGSFLDPAWVAGVAAVVLAARGLARAELTVPGVAHSAHVPFAGFVLALGVVVAAVGHGPLGDLLAELVPASDTVTTLPALLAVAAVGAVLSNLVNNLPATLLLVPLVAPLGAVPVLATLIGINLGSSMTWAGSLANLLWRRTVRRCGHDVDSRDFHLVGLLATPVAIVGGVVVLHLWSGVV